MSNLIRFAKRKCKVAKDSVRVRYNLALSMYSSSFFSTDIDGFYFIQLMLSADNGYDARSMEFLEREGFNGISCLPAQVPKDKVLAAQAHIRRLAGGSFNINNTLSSRGQSLCILCRIRGRDSLYTPNGAVETLVPDSLSFLYYLCKGSNAEAFFML